MKFLKLVLFMNSFVYRKDFRLWNIDSPCVCGVEANNVGNNKSFFKFLEPLFFGIITGWISLKLMLLHQGLCLNLAVSWTSKPLEETQPGLFYTEFCKIRHMRFRLEGLNLLWFGHTLSFINIRNKIQ